MRLIIAFVLFFFCNLVMYTVIRIERLQGKHGYDNYLKGFWDGDL